MDNRNYLHIEGWMVNELHLKGNDLLVYAIIYGFSQNGESRFTGSLQYLADWCSATKQGIQKNLKSLIDMNLITKYEVERNNQKFCEYSVNDITDSVAVPQKDKKKNLYEQCEEIIDEEFIDDEVKEELKTFLSVRIKSPMSAKSFKTIVLELRSLAKTKADAIAIIKNAYEKNYMKFYPVTQSQYKKKTYTDNLSDVKHDAEYELLEQYREEFALVFPDERPSFEEWRKTK